MVLVKKVMFHLILIILTKEMEWCHWWFHWYHIMLMLVPRISHDQKVMLYLLLVILTYQMKWCYWWHSWLHVTETQASKASNDQQSYVTHCFNYLDLMNTGVLFTMLLASHDADASTNIVKWLKMSSCIWFWESKSNKCSNVVDDATSVRWCQSWHHMTKTSYCNLFQSSWPYKQNGDACTGTNRITWWVMSYFASIVFT